MKSIVRNRLASLSILAFAWGAGLGASGCTTTEVNGVPDGGGGSGSSSGGGSGSSSGSSGSGSGSGSGSSSGSSGSGGGGCFAMTSTCATVAAPTIADFEGWMPTAPDGAVADPTQFTFYVNGPPPAPNSMLCGMQYINDGDGSPALTIVPGYNSKYAVHIGTTTAVGAGMNASNDWGGFLSFDFLPPAGTTACINPATYSGIRFWARGTSGSGSMGVVVGTVENVPASNGGRCAPSADGGGCSDSTVKLNIPATWAQFTLPWNQFAGGGGMSTAGCALPPGSGIVHIQFQPYELYPAATNYKVSPMPYWLEIDNIEFF